MTGVRAQHQSISNNGAIVLMATLNRPSPVLFGCSTLLVADNYPDIGSKGIPEDVFHGLSDEFSQKFPYKMAYWVRPCIG